MMFTPRALAFALLLSTQSLLKMCRYVRRGAEGGGGVGGFKCRLMAASFPASQVVRKQFGFNLGSAAQQFSFDQA